MVKKALLPIVLAAMLLAGCSLDAFDFLHRATTVLKDNVAISSGLVPVDSSELLALVTPTGEGTVPAEQVGGYYRFGNVEIDFGLEADDLPILYPIDDVALDALVGASSNTRHVEALREALSEEAPETLAGYVRNTWAAFESLVDAVAPDGDDPDWYATVHETLSAFLRDGDGAVTLRDVISCRITMLTLTTALDSLDEGDAPSKWDAGRMKGAIQGESADLTTEFIDSMANILGSGKTAAAAIGDSALYEALDGVLRQVLGGI